MVTLVFGLPGAGKTTLMASNVVRHLKKRKYRHVYGNVRMAIPGYIYIDNDCIGKYDISDCALHIDEATLFADNRAYKEFDKGKLVYFLEHRHFGADIFLYTQQWDGVDKKIRTITDRVFYIYKPFFFGRWWSIYYRIPYGIIIPDKKMGGEKLGEIIQGYCKPSLLIRLFAPKIFRPKFYKFFDSFERPYLPPLPKRYVPYVKVKGKVVKTVPAPEEKPEEVKNVSTPEQPSKVIDNNVDQQDPAVPKLDEALQAAVAQPSTVNLDVIDIRI